MPITKAVTEVGWKRPWVITDGLSILGKLTLQHHLHLSTTLSIAIAHDGYGEFRSRSGPRRSVDGTRSELGAPTKFRFDYLTGFSHNHPARALYKKFGFYETVREFETHHLILKTLFVVMK